MLKFLAPFSLYFYTPCFFPSPFNISSTALFLNSSSSLSLFFTNYSSNLFTTTDCTLSLSTSPHSPSFDHHWFLSFVQHNQTFASAITHPIIGPSYSVATPSSTSNIRIFDRWFGIPFKDLSMMYMFVYLDHKKFQLCKTYPCYSCVSFPSFIDIYPIFSAKYSS